MNKKIIRVLWILIMMGLLANCANKIQTTNNASVVTDKLVFWNGLGRMDAKRDYIFDLEVMSISSESFVDRAEQLNRVLSVFDYIIDYSNTDVSLHDLSPSLYLLENQTISVSRFLQLARPKDTLVVIDPHLRTISFRFNMPVGVVENISSGSDKLASLDIRSSNAENTSKDEMAEGVEAVRIVGLIDDSLVVDEKSIVVVSMVELEGTDVVDKDETKFVLSSGFSLRDCFNLIAEQMKRNLITSMDGNDWFLSSSISREYEFVDVEDALKVLVAEANIILNKSGEKFNLGIKQYNNLLEVVSE